MSKVESAIRTGLKFNEAFNRHDVSGMLSLMSEDCVFESAYPAPGGIVYSGKPAIAQFWQDFFNRSPQAHIKIEEVFGFAYRCILRWRYDPGERADGRGWIRGVDIYQVKNDQITEMLSYIKGSSDPLQSF